MHNICSSITVPAVNTPMVYKGVFATEEVASKAVEVLEKAETAVSEEVVETVKKEVVETVKKANLEIAKAKTHAEVQEIVAQHDLAKTTEPFQKAVELSIEMVKDVEDGKQKAKELIKEVKKDAAAMTDVKNAAKTMSAVQTVVEVGAKAAAMQAASQDLSAKKADLEKAAQQSLKSVKAETAKKVSEIVGMGAVMIDKCAAFQGTSDAKKMLEIEQALKDSGFDTSQCCGDVAKLSSEAREKCETLLDLGHFSTCFETCMKKD